MYKFYQRRKTIQDHQYSKPSHTKMIGAKEAKAVQNNQMRLKMTDAKAYFLNDN